MKRLFVAVAAIVLFAGPALAADRAPLTDEKIRNFVASMEAIKDLGRELEASGKTKLLMDQTAPKAGEDFKPYAKAVAALKEKYPADHDRLVASVKPYGFSAETWAETGDRIIVAYIAEKAEQEHPGGLGHAQPMDPAMLASIPSEMRVQIETAMAMMETVKNAPVSDRDAVRPHLNAIDAQLAASAR